jgi:hypothetical protein
VGVVEEAGKVGEREAVDGLGVEVVAHMRVAGIGMFQNDSGPAQ